MLLSLLPLLSLVWVVTALGAVGCVTPDARKITYTTDELRAEIARRLPEDDPADAIVPFQVDPDAVARARALTSWAQDPHVRLEVLASVLSEELGFGLEYDSDVTLAAQEALDAGRGNCLTLASVLVGLARPLDLPVHYIAGRDLVQEEGDDLRLAVGHVGVELSTAQGRTAVDFAGALNRYRTFRVIDDLEAAAHFYNNRGYEVLRDQRHASEAVRWARADADFERATRVSPGFAFAWNNRGIAAARLGDEERAIAYYRHAIELEPNVSSPYTNLGMLHLSRGELEPARELLSRATRLDPRNAGLHREYGRLLTALGDIDEARRILAIAVELAPEDERTRMLWVRAREARGR